MRIEDKLKQIRAKVQRQLDKGLTKQQIAEDLGYNYSAFIGHLKLSRWRKHLDNIDDKLTEVYGND